MGLGGNVYRNVIEKQGIVAGIVVYQQRVLQTVTSLDVLSLLFRRRQRPPENRKFWSPARSQIFTMETIRSPRRASEMEFRSRSQLKGAWPNVRTESK